MAMTHMMQKLELYDETGNVEYLMDASNYCFLECRYGYHPEKHFHATDREG